jgi:hypothetical protein
MSEQLSLEEQEKLQKDLATSLKRENVLQNLMKEMRAKLLLQVKSENVLKPSSSIDTLSTGVKVEPDYQKATVVEIKANSDRTDLLESELEASRAEIERLKEENEKKIATMTHVGNL